MTDSRQICIYHAGCFDGFCAAWLWQKAYPESKLHPAYHGSAPPDCTGLDVMIVDFSYKRPVLLDLATQARSLVVLDHHQSASDDLANFAEAFATRMVSLGREFDYIPPIVHFDQERSGGRLMWDYLKASSPQNNSLFFRSDVTPWIVDYTEDRDLWTWKLPLSKEVNAAFRSYPVSFAEWDRWDQLPGAVTLLAAEGASILRREAQIVEQHTRHAIRVALGGQVVPCVNATVLHSEIGQELSKGQPFSATYFDRQDGLRSWSLRSQPDGLDVSEIARLYGGGGHKHASGFETATHFLPRVADNPTRDAVDLGE